MWYYSAMQKEWFNSIFRRWSFILLAFSGVFWLVVYYLAMCIIFLTFPPGSMGFQIEVIYFVSCFATQCVTLFLLIVYLFLERNPDFRIRNKVLVRLSDNIVYKIFVILSVILEIALFLFLAFLTVAFFPVVLLML